jgi:hypothetical protein
MILVLGAWTFLRALLGSSPPSAWRTSLCVINWPSCSAPSVALGFVAATASFAVLARLWPSWRSSLLIVQPLTVLAWHRKGFQLYWRWEGSPDGPGQECRLPGGYLRQQSVTLHLPQIGRSGP